MPGRCRQLEHEVDESALSSTRDEFEPSMWAARLADQTLSARAELLAAQHLLNQRGAYGLVHRCEPHQTGIQTLQLRLRERIEIHTRGRLARAHRLPPAQQNFRVACRADRALAEATLDLRIRRRLTATPGCAASPPFTAH
jgi:hypothetical protein